MARYLHLFNDRRINDAFENSSIMKIRCLISIVCILIAFSSSFAASRSSGSSVSIKATATVVEQSEIELITVKNMEIDASMAEEGRIYISAQRNPNAAMMMVKGKAESSIRINFLPVNEITNSRGKGALSFQYEVYGFESDNQGASEPIDAAERILKMNKEGLYYFWVGGRIDISKARPGNYSGEFTIEVEYI